MCNSCLDGLIWTWIYHPDLGLLNQVLSAAGLKALTRNWLSDPNIALYPVIIAATWNAAIDQRFILEDFFAKLARWYRKT